MGKFMIVFVLYLMIGPSGAALSVDRLIVRYWARRRHLPEPEFLRPPPSVSANLALRLLQIHVCIIYAASGLSKLQGPAWWNGWAVWGTMANYEFSPMQFHAYMEFLRSLCRHRVLWQFVISCRSYFTLASEVGFAFWVG